MLSAMEKEQRHRLNYALEAMAWDRYLAATFSILQ
jgi:hypothetical protein